eukprot:gene13147-16074_t
MIRKMGVRNSAEMVSRLLGSPALRMIPVTAKESSMQIVTLYVSTATIFLVIDAIMLRLYMAPLFERYIGPMMLENIRLAPAALLELESRLVMVADDAAAVNRDAAAMDGMLSSIARSVAVQGAEGREVHDFLEWARADGF